MRQPPAFSQNAFKLLILSILAGCITGWLNIASIWPVVYIIVEIFIRLLTFLSLPLIFFAIIATLSELESSAALRHIGKRLLYYITLTTWFAAIVALSCFLLFGVADIPSNWPIATSALAPEDTYLQFARQIIPDNIVRPFLENQVMAVSLMALLFGAGVLHLPPAQRHTLQPVLSALFATLLKIATTLLKFIPLVIWAFVSIAIQQYQAMPDVFQDLLLYVLAVISANVIQGLVVLPLLLWHKGISPLRSVRAMWPALLTAFFSKSSSATLPLTLSCITHRAGVSPKMANTVVPLCTALNMNGCAAFILITVLFVSAQHGIHFTTIEMMGWTVIATIAAIGNAGVPMGCFFLTSALLMSKNVPLTLMGLILPMYALFDMVETTLNVWSDACITMIMHQENERQAL